LKFFNHLRRHSGDDFFFRKWWRIFSIATEGGCVMFSESLQWPCGHLCYDNWNFLVVVRLAIEIHFWLLPNVKKFFFVSMLTNVTNVSWWTHTWHLMQNGLVTSILTTLTTSWGPNFFFFGLIFLLP
jgi:hypothetical protein